MPVHIRPADLGDIRHLRKLMHALARYHGEVATATEASLHRDLFRDPVAGFALVAESEAQAICGYALLVPLWKPHTDERAIQVSHLYVSSSHRGQGIGRRLIDASRRTAQARGASNLTIGTNPDNAKAQAFYRHLGLAEAPMPGPRFVEVL